MPSKLPTRSRVGSTSHTRKGADQSPHILRFDVPDVRSTAKSLTARGVEVDARLVDEWVIAIGLRPEEYGTHSLRRTKASIIYKATANLRAAQILLGHANIENTVRYLGVDVEDALALAEATKI